VVGVQGQGAWLRIEGLALVIRGSIILIGGEGCTVWDRNWDWAYTINA